ncbi:PREDICTED: beta-defensin 129 [Condylura cristata]|uniref:beta-defensin 129 n=1 Tax=Condylura cristata TaxID=143302 RepID=UPI000334395A|nr:PREDICTED: beta-defensin 129 [Condylura cristata]
MKLLFPIFASLMLQYHVNTEFLILRRCLMGFGKCKDHCSMGEKEVQKCKKKKCCIGPKVVQMLKNYIQNEMSHAFEENSQELQKTAKNSRALQTKYQALLLLPQMKSTWLFVNSSTISTSNSSTGNSATTKPRSSRKFTQTTATRDAKEVRASAPASPPPAPPLQSPTHDWLEDTDQLASFP